MGNRDRSTKTTALDIRKARSIVFTTRDGELLRIGKLGGFRKLWSSRRGNIIFSFGEWRCYPDTPGEGTGQLLRESDIQHSENAAAATRIIHMLAGEDQASTAWQCSVY